RRAGVCGGSGHPAGHGFRGLLRAPGALGRGGGGGGRQRRFARATAFGGRGGRVRRPVAGGGRLPVAGSQQQHRQQQGGNQQEGSLHGAGLHGHWKECGRSGVKSMSFRAQFGDERAGDAQRVLVGGGRHHVLAVHHQRGG